MAKSSKKQRIHNWSKIVHKPGECFVYICSKCAYATVNGEPLPMPQKEECL